MKSGYVNINNKTFSVVLALTNEEQEKGLMYQKYPHPNMAFVYGSPKVLSFWMKNTPSALDIVFCNNGEITKIAKGVPYSTEVVGNVVGDLVIEFPINTCSANKFNVGDKVKLLVG